MLLRPSGQARPDVGFHFLPTADIKHEITGDSDALRIGLHAANCMAGRYNPEGRFIRAWNGQTGWAIIDCMMNLSLLFWASRATGDPRYGQIALRHADTTLVHGIRDDGSACHILAFDPANGEFLGPIGGQGLAPDSAWSRGNAWALNGFANTYKHTGERRFLDAAKRIAHHFIAALPEDACRIGISVCLDGRRAARQFRRALAASGLLEIADAVPAPESRTYRAASARILRSLTEHYATWDMPDHEAILLHGTGHKPENGNVDVSLIYGDYFYVEAFAKLAGWQRRMF